VRELSKVENFRELGGYKTKDGKIVKKGLLYRSANLFNLSDKAKEHLDAVGFALIFDLRSNRERDEKPDYVPKGAKYVQESALQFMDTENSLNRRNKDGSFDMREHVLKAGKDEVRMQEMELMMREMYPEMIRKCDAYRVFFKCLLEADGEPILYHCSAGKDRTGVCSALILRILGVPDDVIMDDYLLSNKRNTKKNKELILKSKLFLRNKKLKKLIAQMLGVAQPLLESALKEIDNLYGNFDNFVHEGLGLSQTDVEKLKNIYLV
jgi:protein-tyrosine phosphatase